LSKTTKQVFQDKVEQMMYVVAERGTFYRENPQRFCVDYCNITGLKTFQKINLYEMMHSTHVIYVAARGQGKSWLLALFCICRCILYPGTKIVIASGTKGQALEILTKIDEEFCKNYTWGSANIRNEIEELHTGVNKPICKWRNGSTIKVVTSDDNARHNRANIVIVDEYRMVAKKIIDNVLKKFLTDPRHPLYLDKPEYVHLQERNMEMYATSAWYKSHWSYKRFVSFVKNMLDHTKRYFVCALPYQLSIKEGLLMREQIEDEMSEDDFDQMSFDIEMGSLWYSDTDGSFFKFSDIEPLRTERDSIIYPLEAYDYSTMHFKLPKLVFNERRILSVDIALMNSKKHDNDASALIINRNLPVSDYDYMNHIVSIDTYEGLTTDELGLIIMRTFYRFNCTDLVMDTNGVGLGVADYIAVNRFDPELGVEYQALKCINDESMAERCKEPNANKAFWSIKANATFNSDTATALRAQIQNKKLTLPITELQSKEYFNNQKGYSKLNPAQKAKCLYPYVQTSALINELINLEYEVVGEKIRITEKNGMRKDRYSSLQYNLYVAQQIRLKKKIRKQTQEQEAQMLIHMRMPKRVTRYR